MSPWIGPAMTWVTRPLSALGVRRSFALGSRSCSELRPSGISFGRGLLVAAQRAQATLPVPLAATGFKGPRARKHWDWRRATALGAALVAGGLAAQGRNGNLARCEAAVPPAAAVAVPPADSARPGILAKCLAEAIGTGIVVHGGCGVAASSKYCGSGITTGGAALVWGITVALAVYATRDVSGAHLNPAITASLAVNKPEAFPKEEALPYILAQIFGAAVAGAVNYFVARPGIAAFEKAEGIIRGTAASAASFNGAFGMLPNAKLVTPLGALALEIWMTSVFAFLVFAATDPDNTVPSAAAPALIGAAVAMLISTFGPITGCGMNPARDLGPRLVTAVAGWGSAAASSWWVYTLGPVLGAILGGALYQATLAQKK